MVEGFWHLQFYGLRDSAAQGFWGFRAVGLLGFRAFGIQRHLCLDLLVHVEDLLLGCSQQSLFRWMLT